MKTTQDDDGLKHSLQHLYDEPLPDRDAEDAARNLVGLFEVLLEIHQEGGQGHAAH